MSIVAALCERRIIFRLTLNLFGGRYMSKGKTDSDIFRGFCRGDGFGAHGEESAEKENGCAPKLSVTQAFAINPGGECECGGGTEKLERLGERNADLADRHVIQDVCERNAAHGRDDKNQVNVRSRIKRRGYLAKGESKWKKQCRSDEADETKTADRSELSR